MVQELAQERPGQPGHEPAGACEVRWASWLVGCLSLSLSFAVPPFLLCGLAGIKLTPGKPHLGFHFVSRSQAGGKLMIDLDK